MKVIAKVILTISLLLSLAVNIYLLNNLTVIEKDKQVLTENQILLEDANEVLTENQILLEDANKALSEELESQLTVISNKEAAIIALEEEIKRLNSLNSDKNNNVHEVSPIDFVLYRENQVLSLFKTQEYYDTNFGLGTFKETYSSGGYTPFDINVISYSWFDVHFPVSEGGYSVEALEIEILENVITSRGIKIGDNIEAAIDVYPSLVQQYDPNSYKIEHDESNLVMYFNTKNDVITSITLRKSQD